VSVPNPTDALASLAKPAVPACGTSTNSPYFGLPSALMITGIATLYPNYAYCGGVTILPEAKCDVCAADVWDDVEERRRE